MAVHSRRNNSPDLLQVLEGRVLSRMYQAGPELLGASDETIDDAVKYADPLALRGLLYQLTGDEDLLEVELRTLVVGGYREMYQVARADDAARIRGKAAGF